MKCMRVFASDSVPPCFKSHQNHCQLLQSNMCVHVCVSLSPLSLSSFFFVVLEECYYDWIKLFFAQTWSLSAPIISLARPAKQNLHAKLEWEQVSSWASLGSTNKVLGIKPCFKSNFTPTPHTIKIGQWLLPLDSGLNQMVILLRLICILILLSCYAGMEPNEMLGQGKALNKSCVWEGQKEERQWHLSKTAVRMW